jgi:hypothetical protein
VHGDEEAGIVGRPPAAIDGDRSAERGVRAGVIASLLERDAEVAQVLRNAGVTITKTAPIDCNRLAQQRLLPPGVPAAARDGGQVDEGGRDGRVGRAEPLPPDHERPRQHCLRLGVCRSVPKDATERVQLVGHVETLGAAQLLRDRECPAREGVGLVVQAEVRMNVGQDVQQLGFHGRLSNQCAVHAPRAAGEQLPRGNLAAA